MAQLHRIVTNFKRRLWLVIVAGLILTACGPTRGSAPNPAEAQPDPAEAQPGVSEIPRSTCPDGPTRPLEWPALAAALAEHGVYVYPNPESGVCSANDVMMHLTNILFRGPYENISDHDRILRDYGYVGCAIRSKSIYMDSREETHEGSVDPDGVKLRLANIECNIFPNAENASAQIGRLRAAFADLERVLAR
jgi:hypothetical protein